VSGLAAHAIHSFNAQTSTRFCVPGAQMPGGDFSLIAAVAFAEPHYTAATTTLSGITKHNQARKALPGEINHFR
jgi:hypothetical protein